jgi:hypothetical protein
MRRGAASSEDGGENSREGLLHWPVSTGSVVCLVGATDFIFFAARSKIQPPPTTLTKTQPNLLDFSPLPSLKSYFLIEESHK